MDAAIAKYLNWYRKRVAAIPRLSDEECEHYAKERDRCRQEGNAWEADRWVDQLALSYLYLLVPVLGRQRVNVETLEDIFQDAYLSLRTAADQWDPLSSPFGGFAWRRVKWGAIKSRHQTRHAGLGTNGSRDLLRTLGRIEQEQAALGVTLNRAELAQVADVTPEAVADAKRTERIYELDAPRRYRSGSRFDGALAAEVGDGYVPNLIHNLPDTTSLSPEEEAGIRMLMDKVRVAVDTVLTDRQRFVFELLSYPEPGKGATPFLGQVGAQMGLSRERVRQINLEALWRIRNQLNVRIERPEQDTYGDE